VRWPCTGEVSPPTTALLVEEAKRDFLSGKSRAIRERLGRDDPRRRGRWSSSARRACATASPGCRPFRASRGSIPAGVEEADVFAVVEEAGQFCIEVFFFRAGQNWGNAAYFPRADRALPWQKCSMLPWPVL
jgi:excinuclease ABC subunit C